jgi:hypothetical protein
MSTNIISPSPPAPTAGRMTRALASNRWAPLVVVLTGTFMVVLDFFIVNLALPSMQAHLHASSGALEWVVAGYGLTSAVFLVTAGRLGDRFGRRRMFMLGLELFTVSSALCGIAPSPGVLIVGRLLQGLGGALLMPPVNALRLALHPNGMAPRVLNLAQWRGHLLERLERIVGLSGDPELRKLQDELLSYPGGAEDVDSNHNGEVMVGPEFAQIKQRLRHSPAQRADQPRARAEPAPR